MEEAILGEGEDMFKVVKFKTIKIMIGIKKIATIFECKKSVGWSFLETTFDKYSKYSANKTSIRKLLARL